MRDAESRCRRRRDTILAAGFSRRGRRAMLVCGTPGQARQQESLSAYLKPLLFSLSRKPTPAMGHVEVVARRAILRQAAYAHISIRGALRTCFIDGRHDSADGQMSRILDAAAPLVSSRKISRRIAKWSRAPFRFTFCLPMAACFATPHFPAIRAQHIAIPHK